MNELIFKLSNVEYIKMISDSVFNPDKLKLCDGIKIYFINGRQELCIGEESAGLAVENFIKKLKIAIDNKLQLHKSINQNLGLIYNEHFLDEPENMMVSTLDGSDKYWVIYDYEIWSTHKKSNLYVTTWLYNDDKDNIVIDVTKIYPWFYSDESDFADSHFIYYEDFIKDYKSLLHCVIPRDIAISWIEQAEKWLQIFSENEKTCTRPAYFLKNK